MFSEDKNEGKKYEGKKTFNVDSLQIIMHINIIYSIYNFENISHYTITNNTDDVFSLKLMKLFVM